MMTSSSELGSELRIKDEDRMLSSSSMSQSVNTDAKSPRRYGIVSRLMSLYNGFHAKRATLDLPYPGTLDNICKETERDVMLNNLSFTGFRADLTKAFGASPLFQISHTLALGSQVPTMPPYTYAALYGSPTSFLQANIDSDCSLNARFNRRITPKLTTRVNTQITRESTSPAMLQAEADYAGNDFSASIKMMNPSILSGAFTGMVLGSYFQSVTSKLALGLESIWQRPDSQYGPDIMTSYALRYKTSQWIASARILGQGAIQATYWRRLTDKVEAGADLNLNLAGVSAIPGGADIMGIPRREGIATFGIKYDFRASSYRAQIDSLGKVACLLEKSVAPAVRLTFSGEVDQWKQQTKIGLGVSIESADPEVMEAQEKLKDVIAPPF